MYAVRFIFVRIDRYLCKFDLDVCGSIYFCTVRLIFVEVRFIFVRFDLFFAVLILNERVSLYLCAFNIVWTRFVRILSVTERHNFRCVTKNSVVRSLWYFLHTSEINLQGKFHANVYNYSTLESFQMTSRQLCWCTKTKKRRPNWRTRIMAAGHVSENALFRYIKIQFKQ